MMANIIINDLFDEIIEENSRLSSELLFANKCLALLNKYRQCLTVLSDCCLCVDNFENKRDLTLLEDEYKTVVNSELISENKLNTDLVDTKTPVLISDLTQKINQKNSTKTKLSFIKSNGNNNNSSISSKNANKTIKCDKEKSKIVKFFNTDQRLSTNIINKIYIKKFDLMSNQSAKRIKQKYSKRKIDYGFKDLYKKEENGFRCNFTADCMYINDRLERVKAHINKVHTKERPFECEQCGQTFTRSDYVSEHRNRVHSTVKYRCDDVDCDYETISYKALVYHQLRHNSSKQFACDKIGCDKRFYRKADLRNHTIRVHTETRPFRCDWPGCESAFKTFDAAKDHTKIHTGEKPFACDWPGCDWRFTLNSQLTKHSLIHKQIKDFVCNWPNCGKRFRKGWNLKVHYMVHSGERPYKCEFAGCERRFTEKRNMLKHFSSHTDNNSDNQPIHHNNAHSFLFTNFIEMPTVLAENSKNSKCKTISDSSVGCGGNNFDNNNIHKNLLSTTSAGNRIQKISLQNLFENS